MVLRAAQANIGDGKETIVSSNNLNLVKELQTYKTMVADLENRLTEYTHIMQQHNEKNKENKELEYQLKLKTDELEKLKKDQEDLLELLTDQDSKIILYKERLIELGDKVSFMKLFIQYVINDMPSFFRLNLMKVQANLIQMINQNRVIKIL